MSLIVITFVMSTPLAPSIIIMRVTLSVCAAALLRYGPDKVVLWMKSAPVKKGCITFLAKSKIKCCFDMADWTLFAWLPSVNSNQADSTSLIYSSAESHGILKACI